jgi:hypothetical protein
MSVQIHEESGGKILVVDLTGKLMKEDYEQFGPEVEQAVNKHRKVRMLVRMHDFHGWSAGALWEDVKFDFRHFAHFDRLAFVGDKRWEANMAVFCKPFTTAKIRYFDFTDEAQALNWIHEGVATAGTAAQAST